MRNNEELKRSHANGFGGSDAKMFAKIGTKGIESLSTTEKKRILVALGKMEAEDFCGNVYTEAGHLFEDYCAESTPLSKCEREKYIECKDAAKHFKVFAHADFYDNATDEVFECKFSQYDTEKVLEDYYEQLQWYYLCGAKAVTLVHGHGGVLPFIMEGIVTEALLEDEYEIGIITRGIEVLDKEIDEGMFEGYEATEITMSEMTGDAAVACRRLGLAMAQLKECEKLADEYKATLLAWMEAHGVLNIKGDDFTVSYVSPTQRKTFDTKKAQADFPALKDDKYYKTSSVKSSVKITLNQ